MDITILSTLDKRLGGLGRDQPSPECASEFITLWEALPRDLRDMLKGKRITRVRELYYTLRANEQTIARCILELA